MKHNEGNCAVCLQKAFICVNGSKIIPHIDFCIYCYDKYGSKLDRNEIHYFRQPREEA
jgi:hypothetical protein